MEISTVHPEFKVNDYVTGLQEILRNVFVKTNFVPGIRHIIGWRGLKDSSSGVDAWTAKVRGVNGIYGICFNGADKIGEDNFYRAEFLLYYFPHPEEDIVEKFSIPAGITAMRDDYFEMVRSFTEHEGMSHLFNLGKFTIVTDRDSNNLAVTLEALSESRIIAEEGLNIIKEGSELRVLENGEVDQSLPAFDILFPFFEVIASSFTFNMGEAPVSLYDKTGISSYKQYNQKGAVKEVECDEIKIRSLMLVYGNSELSPSLNIALNDCHENTAAWTGDYGDPCCYGEALWWRSHEITDLSTLDKNILGVDNRPHFIVVTGFLGSGKTSFLQNFIEYQVIRNQFVAVIQNEIGEISLDSRLLDQNYAVTEMDEGCVCCTLVGNLKGAISGIQSEFSPDYIVLETTGVANPANLLSEIFELEEKVRFDSVTALIDSVNIEKTLSDYEVAREQLRTSDILLLNKSDLIDVDREEAIVELVRKYNEHAPVIFTKNGDINPALIYDPDGLERTSGPDEKSMSDKSVQDDENHHSHEHSHEHDHGHHHHHHSHHYDSLSSIKLDMAAPLIKEKFLDAVKNLPPQIFRVKGIITFTDRDCPMFFQYVAGRYEISEYLTQESIEYFLVFIGQHMDEVFSGEKFLKDVY